MLKETAYPDSWFRDYIVVRRRHDSHSCVETDTVVPLYTISQHSLDQCFHTLSS